MIRVKMLANSGVAVIDNGHVYVFDKMGRCTGEDTGEISKYGGNSLSLPVISCLTTNGVLDLALFDDAYVMKRFTMSGNPMECAMSLQLAGGFLRLLRRDGKQMVGNESVSFNQLVFVYKEGTDLLAKISSIKGLKEIT